MLVPIRMFHQHAVPGGMIRNDVNNHFQAAAVRFVDKLLQIVLRAIVRIDCVVVLHRIGTADRSLFLFLTNRMDRHQPKDRDAQILQTIKL